MIVHRGQPEQSAGHKPHGILGRPIHFKPASPPLKPEVIGYRQRPVMTMLGSKARPGVGNPLFLPLS